MFSISQGDIRRPCAHPSAKRQLEQERDHVRTRKRHACLLRKRFRDMFGLLEFVKVIKHYFVTKRKGLEHIQGGSTVTKKSEGMEVEGV